jgi:NAD(P)-dependent dehydrogenase (short-subunit alcohol dehydrogenase family)
MNLEGKDRLEEAIPLGRLGKPEEIAPFIPFLASPDAGTRGACFVVDGSLSVS